MSAEKTVLRVRIRDQADLASMYMPFLKNGGLFVAVEQAYRLGDEISLELVLFDEEVRRLSVRVAWITPKGAQGNSRPGVGVQFLESDEGLTRAKLEKQLAGFSGKRVSLYGM